MRLLQFLHLWITNASMDRAVLGFQEVAHHVCLFIKFSMMNVQVIGHVFDHGIGVIAELAGQGESLLQISVCKNCLEIALSKVALDITVSTSGPFPFWIEL